MTDRPIIFSGPMVRALLEGRKTQTRRVLKNVPKAPDPANVVYKPTHPEPYIDSYCSQRKTDANPRGMSENWCWWTRDDRCCVQFKVPYVPGDRLWVRENWRQAYPKTEFSHGAIYRADAERALGMDEYSSRHRWTPSIHMPRWASRLTLIVEAVKVERLQAMNWREPAADYSLCSARYAFASFINELHGGPNWNIKNQPPLWDQNPWVVAVSFRVVRANIDSVPT